MNCPICGSPLICWFNHKAIMRRYNGAYYRDNMNWYCAVCHDWFWSAGGKVQHPGNPATVEEIKDAYGRRRK